MKTAPWWYSTAPYWAGMVGTTFSSVTDIFGRKYDADVAKNNAKAVTGVVKFLGILAAVVTVIAFMFKIIK